MPAQDNKGVVLMAGGAPAAADGLYSVGNEIRLLCSFFHMAAVEGMDMVIPMLEIHTGTERLFQIQRSLWVVLDAHAAGNQIQIFQDSIIKVYEKQFPGIFQGDNQCVGLGVFLSVDCGKAGQSVFPLFYLISRIAQFAGAGTVRVTDL